MASLSDQEIAVLCEVESGRKITAQHQHLLATLIANGFVEVAGDDRAQFKLTGKAHQILAERGAGLNES